jgi:hypothetical protein
LLNWCSKILENIKSRERYANIAYLVDAGKLGGKICEDGGQILQVGLLCSWHKEEEEEEEIK